jgi:hypothetical protein
MIRDFSNGMTTRYCVKCGAEIGPGANFCPRCGTPAAVPATAPAAAVATPPAAAPVAAPRRGSMLIWVAIAFVALGLLAWAVLSGLPFGGGQSRDLRRTETPAPATVGEQAGTTTVSQIAEPSGDTTATQRAVTQPRVATTPTATYPGVTTTAASAPPNVAAPAPQSQPAPAARPTPPPRVVTRTIPAPSINTPQPPVVRDVPSSSPRGEISEAEATQVLSQYLSSSRAYSAPSDCLGVRNLGYKNVGYTLEVVDRCGGGSRGRWRVDSKTREVFRQAGDGRYVRP